VIGEDGIDEQDELVLRLLVVGEDGIEEQGDIGGDAAALESRASSSFV
jgi:hypothetical protein